MRWSTFLRVSIRTTPTLEIGRPQELFEDTYVNRLFGPPQYDVTADGNRFLVLEPARSGGEPITFVLNWTAGMSGEP